MSHTATISIRAASTDDGRTLAHLAALDSAPVPAGTVLLAEVDGEAKAALSLRDGHVVADPFTRTTDLVSLLRVQADAVAERDADRRAEQHTGFARRLRLAA